MPGITSRCTLAVISMLYGRVMFGSGVRVSNPNDEFVDGPSWLTPGTKMLLVAAGFSQLRVSVDRTIGLYACGKVTVENAELYLAMLAFNAVLPLPNRS